MLIKCEFKPRDLIYKIPIFNYMKTANSIFQYSKIVMYCIGRDKSESLITNHDDLKWNESYRASEKRDFHTWLNSNDDVVTSFLDRVKEVSQKSNDINSQYNDDYLVFKGKYDNHLKVLCVSHDNSNKPELITIEKDITNSTRGRELTSCIINKLGILEKQIFSSDLENSDAFALYRIRYTDGRLVLQQNILESNELIACLLKAYKSNVFEHFALFTYDVSLPVINNRLSCTIL